MSSLIVGVIVVCVVFAILITILVYVKCNHKNPSNTQDTSSNSPPPVSTNTSAKPLDNLKKTTATWNIPFDELVFGRLLGKGSQGEVYKASWRGLTVAVKKVDTSKVSQDIIQDFCSEAEIMRKLRHPSLTLFLGVSIQHPWLCIVTEFVSRGSLFDILHDESNAMTWTKALGMAKDIAQGVLYLHEHSPPILHRDLKSLNILIDQNWRAKVADFGMTSFQKEGVMTQCGSPLWMAPEMIRNEKYNEKSDVYSFGVVLWELATKKIPYRSYQLSPQNLIIKIVKSHLRPRLPDNCPKVYMDLMQRCWHPRAEERPGFREILRIVEECQKESSAVNARADLARDARRASVEAKQAPPQDIRLVSGSWQIDLTKEEVVVIKPLGPHRRLENTNSFPSTRNGFGISSVTNIHMPSTPMMGSYQISEIKAMPSNTKKISETTADFSRTNMVTAPNNSLLERKETVAEFVPCDPYEGADPSPNQYYLGSYRGKEVTITRCPLPPSLLAENGSGRAKLSSLMDVIQHLRHPNIVLFMGAFYKPDHIGIVHERMSLGSLQGVLFDSEMQISWDWMIQILIDISQAMAYLHGNKPPIIHEDLRPSRCLVDVNGTVKVGDFLVVDLEKRLNRNPLAPTVWTAPELFSNPLHRTPSSNVYSFAMVAAQVLLRKPLYVHDNFETLLGEIVKGRRPDLPSFISSPLKDLLTKCWDTQPERRPRFQQITEALQSIKAAGPPKFVLRAGDNASVYRKKKTVFAYKSADPIVIFKDWGRSAGLAGSYIIFGGEEDVYMCDSETFEKSYEPTGRPNEFRKHGFVLARKMDHPFAIKTGDGVESGHAGDFLLQNDQGDQWVVEGKKFTDLYEKGEPVYFPGHGRSSFSLSNNGRNPKGLAAPMVNVIQAPSPKNDRK